MFSLVAVAVLVALLLTSTLHSSGSGTTSVTNAPGVAEADGLEAQQALSAALSAVDTAAATSGGYGGLTASALSAAEPSVRFVSGASSSPSQVSVGVGQGATGGSVTLAARADDGTCWLVWKADGTSPWYGAETGQSSCTAPPLAATPAPGPVSSTAIGWQEGGFPAA